MASRPVGLRLHRRWPTALLPPFLVLQRPAKNRLQVFVSLAYRYSVLRFLHLELYGYLRGRADRSGRWLLSALGNPILVGLGSS